MINVREVLQNNSTSTTLQELEAKGRSKVRVINANEISRLIEVAIQQAIAQSGGGEAGLTELVERSKIEFAELKRQRDAEIRGREEGLAQLAQAQNELSQLREKLGELAAMERESLTKYSEKDHELSGERARVGELRNLCDILTKERDLAREAERAARNAAEEARAAQPPQNTELLTQLAAQVAKLTEKIDREPVASAAGAPVPLQDLQKLEARLEQMTSGISDRLEKFGRSMGVSSAVEAENVNYTGIFNNNEKLESNVESLEVKERKSTGINEALERMKKLKLNNDK
ncbi:MAG: hypothetical protein ACKVS6_00220 [Planctomycetota bacterium]